MSGAAERSARYGNARIAGLGLLAVLVLLPVTLPVPVLRELVQHRFGVSELATSAFMSINMVGAFLAAPLVGALADRWGRRRGLLIGALALDALCFLALTADVPFAAFMAIRFVEGCAHISALSLLMGIASGARPEHERSVALGVVTRTYQFTDRSYVGAAQLISVFGPSLVNEFRMQVPVRDQANTRFGPTGTGPAIVIPNQILFGGPTAVGFNYRELAP